MRIKLDIVITRETPVRRLVALMPLLMPLVDYLTRNPLADAVREAMRDDTPRSHRRCGLTDCPGRDGSGCAHTCEPGCAHA